jgi:26S proteasome regulatory subunit N1
MKRQLAFLLTRAQVPIEWLQPPSENADGDADITFQDELPEDLLECLRNSKLSMHFKEFLVWLTQRVWRTPVSRDLTPLT